MTKLKEVAVALLEENGRAGACWVCVVGEVSAGGIEAEGVEEASSLCAWLDGRLVAHALMPRVLAAWRAARREKRMRGAARDEREAGGVLHGEAEGGRVGEEEGEQPGGVGHAAGLARRHRDGFNTLRNGRNVITRLQEMDFIKKI